MRDHRVEKIKQHFDLFLNEQKFKVIHCNIDEIGHLLSIKTKVFGQAFPHNGHFALSIPSKNLLKELNNSFRSMDSNSSIEHWEYMIVTEAFLDRV